MGIQGYYPEMGESKPIAQGTVSLSHYGKHYYICTPLVLKPSRSIVLLKTLTSDDLTDAGQYKVGWHDYKVTEKAMAELEEQYTFSMEFLL